MVCYGLLWSAMVPEMYPIWSPQGQSTRITNHDPWYSVIKSRTEHDGTTSDHVGPRRTTSDHVGPRRTSLRGSSSADTHRANFRRASSQVSQPKKHMAVQVKLCQTGAQQIPVVCMACMVVSWQAVALDISVTLRGCKGSRRIMKAYEIRYCPGLLTRNQQGLWLKMWASWFNMHVIHRHTLNKNIQDVQDVQVPH